MHPAGQRREEADGRDMGLIVQDGLVEMGQAPALRHIEGERFGQLFGRLAGNGVPPGAEGNEQVHIRIEGKVAVHHGADADCSQFAEDDAVLFLHVLLEVGIAGAETGQDGFLTVRPDAVYKIVFPFVAAGSDDRVIRPDEDRLDPCGTEFNTEDRGTALNDFPAHDVPSVYIAF